MTDRNVLIVGDDCEPFKNLFDTLESPSYKLAFAYSAKDAIETIRGFTVQVALIKLPDDNVTTLLGVLKKLNPDVTTQRK